MYCFLNLYELLNAIKANRCWQSPYSPCESNFIKIYIATFYQFKSE